MTILSIQSAVALGYVGNTGAAFALRRLGHEVWPIDAVAFSNHPGHGGFRGRVTTAAEIRTLVEGLAERGALARCRAVLSGYLGAAEQGPPLLEAVAAVKAASPHARFVLDPVIGDAGRVYVKPGVAEFLREHAVPRADVATPNQFELEYLTGERIADTASAIHAVQRLRERGPSLVVATGLALADLGPRRIGVLAIDATGAWRIAAPLVDHPSYGAGDVFTAVLVARLLAGDEAAAASAHAAAAVHALVTRSAARGGKDLALVEGQDDLVQPPLPLAVERLA